MDTIGNGGLVRRVLGLKTAFGKPCDLRSCDHAWSTNEYIHSFGGPQFRYASALVRLLCARCCPGVVICASRAGSSIVTSARRS